MSGNGGNTFDDLCKLFDLPYAEAYERAGSLLHEPGTAMRGVKIRTPVEEHRDRIEMELAAAFEELDDDVFDLGF